MNDDIYSAASTAASWWLQWFDATWFPMPAVIPTPLPSKLSEQPDGWRNGGIPVEVVTTGQRVYEN